MGQGTTFEFREGKRRWPVLRRFRMGELVHVHPHSHDPVGIPRGETAIAHDQRRLHAHNGSSPASFPRPQRQRRCAIQPGVVRVAALPRVLAKSCSLPRKGLCRSCPPRGSISKGGMGRRSLVQMKSPPGGNVHYLHNVQTPHALRSAVRHNRLRGCGAHPTHTRGNAADRVTPGFGAEPLRGSREGDHWTINYKRSRGVLRIETMGDPRERHVRHLPCATIYHVVYRNGWGGVLLKSNRYRRP